MEPSQAIVQTKSVSFRRVCWSFPSVNCPGCASDAQRVWESTRVAVDIDLDQPIVLIVDVSVHVCAVFLRDPTWEPTNNAAERGGRAFRHGQHPHFRLRLVTSIDADLKVRASLKKARFCSPPPPRIHHCQRGRHAPAVTDRPTH